MLLKVRIDQSRPQFHINRSKKKYYLATCVLRDSYGPPTEKHAKWGKYLERDFQISKHHLLSHLSCKCPRGFTWSTSRDTCQNNQNEIIYQTREKIRIWARRSFREANPTSKLCYSMNRNDLSTSGASKFTKYRWYTNACVLFDSKYW